MPNVLFIGNSYTLYHDVPAQVQAICRASGLDVTCTMQAEGGANLKSHSEQLGTPELINEGDWNIVVLQELSTGPLHDSSQFESYATSLAELAKKQGALIALYQTWPRQHDHEVYRAFWSGGSTDAMHEALAESYGSLAEKLAAILLPVGSYWHHAIEEISLQLHDEDGHHANALGAHLSAMVIAKTLFDVENDWRPDEVSAADKARLRSVRVHVS